jgi:hypothetical protein
MEKEFEALSSVALANLQDIEKLQRSHAAIQTELAHLRQSVRNAFRNVGVDFERAAGFVTSRVPTLEVPIAEPTTPIQINPHLRPSASGIIGVVSGNGGDGSSH